MKAMIRVCYFGTYRAEYSRNQIMIEGLRQSGCEVFECHETLWRGIEDRVLAVKEGWKSPAFWGRIIKVYFRLMKKYVSVPDYDVMMVGYPGQFDVFLARILSWVRRKPLVWDIFMSIYLISLERGLEKGNRLSISFLYRVEKFACSLPDLLILDTDDYVEWFLKTYGISRRRFALVPTGADNHIFKPLPKASYDQKVFRIVYYGTFIPNHGVLKIVEAAHLLKDQDHIVFDLIGVGPERAKVEKYRRDNNLSNVHLIDWLSKEQLVQCVQTADLCLGAFGDTPQSYMTIQNKIYECLAMEKPVLTGDGPAVSKAFTHREQIFLCRRNPDDIANAVLELRSNHDLRIKLARNGGAAYRSRYTVEMLGQRCKSHIKLLVDRRADN